MLFLDLLVPLIEAVALRNDLLSVKRESYRQSHIEGDANFFINCNSGKQKIDWRISLILDCEYISREANLKAIVHCVDKEKKIAMSLVAQWHCLFSFMRRTKIQIPSLPLL